MTDLRQLAEDLSAAFARPVTEDELRRIVECFDLGPAVPADVLARIETRCGALTLGLLA